jgi:ADP-heptose:LPS heptosyltransferase
MKPIVVAPFSNSDIRDWPLDHFRDLIGKLIEVRPETVHVIGAPGQVIRARELVRPFDSARVVNDCGRLEWGTMTGLVRGAGCVIGNNSGIAHLAAFSGVPTICIFGAAHQRSEWRPIGPNVIILSRSLACSPCGFHTAAACPFGVACLDQIDPDTVFNVVQQSLTRLPVKAEAFA